MTATNGANGSRAERRIEVWVGIFVCVGLGLAFLVVFLLGRSHQVFVEKVLLRAEFTEVQGLRAGAPVRLSGVDVGTVDRVSFSPSLGNPMIQVQMKVTPEALSRIGQDSVARIGTQGLLGDKLVEISIASASSPRLRSGDWIATVPPADLNRIIEQIAVVLEHVHHIAEDAATVMDAIASPQTVAHVQGTIASLHALLRQSERGPGLVHSLFYSPEEAHAFQQIIATLGHLVADVDAGVQHIDELLKTPDEDGRHLLSHLGRAAREVGETAAALRTSTVLPQLERASADIAEMTRYARSGQGTIGGLVMDPTVYEQLVVILGGVARSRVLRALVRYAISQDVERVAGRVVDGKVSTSPPPQQPPPQQQQPVPRR
jgi:phospholipid/cholesterol/gamma-HCH transport system substrate-binding protein